MFGIGYGQQPYGQSSYGQSSYGQPYIQQSSGMFGSMFGGSERLTQQTIQQIMLQVRQQGITPDSSQKLEEVLTEMVYNGTEKVSNILKQYISPELAAQVLNEVALEDLEDVMEGNPQGQRMGVRGMGVRGSQGMGVRGSQGMGVRGSRGMGVRGMGVEGMEPEYYGSRSFGGKKRRTRGRKQRGGNSPAPQNNLATNAEAFQGGKRRKTHRRKTHRRKH